MIRLLSFLLFFLGFNQVTFAHIGGHHDHQSHRQWTFNNSSQILDASFHSFKDKEVRLEDRNGVIQKFSLEELSQSDQAFVLAKNEQIKLLNQSLLKKRGRSDGFVIQYFGALGWQILLLGLTVLLGFIALKRPKQQVVMPLFLSVFVISLINCTDKSYNTFSTDPAFIESAFAPFKPAIATSWDEAYFYVHSVAFPEGDLMTGITAWNEQVVLPQCYVGDNAWSIPLNPSISDNPLSLDDHFKKGALAVAANGVPIFNYQNNRGEVAQDIGELDAFGGHSGRADDYHYHTVPLHLANENNLPLGFALDGFAIYGLTEPDGSPVSNLDQYGGHLGSDGVYHYHGTGEFPYMMSSIVGNVSLDPMTNAPEDQIVPQARSMPVRQFDGRPQQVEITGFENIGENNYKMTYIQNGQTYSIDYGWTNEGANATYDFDFNNPTGVVSEQFSAPAVCAIEESMNTYQGTATITQGGIPISIISTNLYDCPNGRSAPLGTITATNNSQWTVPADNNFTNADFPFASDLHNPCTGQNYANATQALAALDGTDIIEIDEDGELITGYIFADNYFELYVNGVAVGKDNVPFTQFNSNLVRFRVKRPFTIAMLLVDWEENLGVGTESNQGFQHHAGDGGMVAVFKDANNEIIATTGEEWKAQTFYTAPIKDLTCVTENGTQRLSSDCNTDGSNDASGYYGLHWAVPTDWMMSTFDDSYWSAATTYTNNTIGVNNKYAYTNFTDIFDDSADDAEFIWSTNVVLDNEVIVRYTVAGNTTSTSEILEQNIQLYPNPVESDMTVSYSATTDNAQLVIFTADGKRVYQQKITKGNVTHILPLVQLPTGTYFLGIEEDGQQVYSEKFMKR